MAQLTVEIINRAIRRRFPDVVCEECKFFPKKIFDGNEWVQSQSYVVSLKYVLGSNLTDKSIGEMTSYINSCIEFLEKSFDVDLHLSNDDSVPVIFTWD